MLRIHKFVEDLAKARKTPKEINTMVDTAFEVNSISQSQIYRISALDKAGKDSSDKRSTNRRRKVRTDDFIEAVRVYVRGRPSGDNGGTGYQVRDVDQHHFPRPP
ncbi:Hypothetical protein FKW44_020918 [Caligus rogercresseyi]|uniref:Uncharacterized protein n=1 Tax=Caligus rogercresseyi TaxID=217165 RepID=A0A7T8GQL9_CALRO|nr:Hypothetical protein FKW44_020918 [Caligus rogercresseyi]